MENHAKLLPHEQIRALAEIGIMAARRRDVDTAEVIFRAIELSHPNRSMAYAGQALARLAVGRPAQALAAVDRGLRLARPEDHGELHTLRGVALLAVGRPAECGVALRQAGDNPLAMAMREPAPAAPASTGAPTATGKAAAAGAGGPLQPQFWTEKT
jgi:Flp pilus assembly protein TadD